MNMTTPNNKTNHLKLLKQVLRPVLRGSIAILVLSLPFAANAQDRTITLDEAIKLGLDNSKTLKLSNSKVEQAVSQYNQAKDEALPTGKVSYGYNRAQIPANRLALGSESFNLPSHADAYL